MSLPDVFQAKGEAAKDRLAGDFRRVLEILVGVFGAINVDAFFHGIDEPAEPGAVIDVLRHLPLQGVSAG